MQKECIYLQFQNLGRYTDDAIGCPIVHDGVPVGVIDGVDNGAVYGKLWIEMRPEIFLDSRNIASVSMELK